MGVTTQAADVEAILQAAYKLAAQPSDALVADEALQFLCSSVEYLQFPLVPKTYLPVVATMLVAKAIHGDKVDVTVFQAGAGSRGFSASSVASMLAASAKSHLIDLRSTSQSPFNNQPFTFKHALRDIEPAKKHRQAFAVLKTTADAINVMSTDTALRALALTFVLTRRVDAPVRVVEVSGGHDAFKAVCSDLAAFVTARSDGGRVGQAVCAGLLDLTHADVIMGAVNDPDVKVAGDVHAMDDHGPWLWCEVKQKVIVTGDVVAFMRKVIAAGGQRCLYLALANRCDSDKIDVQQVRDDAAAFGVELTLVQGPERAIALLTQFAPGDLGGLAARLLERMRIRLVESDGTPEVLAALDRLIERHGKLM